MEEVAGVKVTSLFLLARTLVQQQPVRESLLTLPGPECIGAAIIRRFKAGESIDTLAEAYSTTPLSVLAVIGWEFRGCVGDAPVLEHRG